MARKFKAQIGVASRTPRRGEVWLVVDRDEKHNGRESERVYKNNIQGGTRTCVVVSNNDGNTYSPNVEVVYTTTRKKSKLPTHFMTEATPEPSTVQCEAIMTVSKKDLTKYYGALTPNEKAELDECLKVSLALKKKSNHLDLNVLARATGLSIKELKEKTYAELESMMRSIKK